MVDNSTGIVGSTTGAQIVSGLKDPLGAVQFHLVSVLLHNIWQILFDPAAKTLSSSYISAWSLSVLKLGSWQCAAMLSEAMIYKTLLGYPSQSEFPKTSNFRDHWCQKSKLPATAKSSKFAAFLDCVAGTCGIRYYNVLPFLLTLHGTLILELGNVIKESSHQCHSTAFSCRQQLLCEDPIDIEQRAVEAQHECGTAQALQCTCRHLAPWSWLQHLPAQRLWTTWCHLCSEPHSTFCNCRTCWCFLWAFRLACCLFWRIQRLLCLCCTVSLQMRDWVDTLTLR